MDRQNPFNPGAGDLPPYLAGRSEQQTRFADEVLRMKTQGKGRLLLMYGPRGMGKTTLLDWLKAHCEKQGVPSVMGSAGELLSSLERLSKALAPKRRLLGRWAVNMSVAGLGSAGLGAGADDDGMANTLSGQLRQRCRRKPLALLVDETHAAPDMRTLHVLLNAGQLVAQSSPFLLALAGTPGVEETLKHADATFVERVNRIGVGLLDGKAAAEAVQRPMNERGMTIAEDALAQIVQDSQGYPYFLQQWGRALWDHAMAADASALTLADSRRVGERVQAARDAFYSRRSNDMAEDDELFAAANAVAEVFTGHASLSRDAVMKAVADGLASLSMPPAEIKQKRKDALNELIRAGFVWTPPDAAPMVPGIPSFMAYVQNRFKASSQL